MILGLLQNSIPLSQSRSIWIFLYRPSENIVDADRKLYRRTFSDRSIPDKRIPSRTLPIVEVSSAAFLYIGQQFLAVFCEGDELRDGAQLSPQWSRLKTTAHIKQKRNILTCQFAVENHLSLGKIDKVKKKPVPILTLRKEYDIVIKHRINFHSSA